MSISGIVKKLHSLIKKGLLKLIVLYQKTLSPDHGLFKTKYPHGFCRFFPTCSEYAYTAIEKNGIVKGSFLAGQRILKCNPWVEPKVDKVN